MSKQAETMRAKGYWTVAEASRRAGVSSATVYRWLDEDAVKDLKVGAARYVNVASLARFLGAEGAKALGIGAKGEAS